MKERIRKAVGVLILVMLMGLPAILNWIWPWLGEMWVMLAILVGFNLLMLIHRFT